MRRHVSPESYRRVALPLLGLLGVLDGVLLANLVIGSEQMLPAALWCVAHTVIAALAAAMVMLQTAAVDPNARRGIFILSFVLAVSVPFVGILGMSMVYAYGIPASARKDHGDTPWRFTANPELPFTIPARRSAVHTDTRGLVEQVMHEQDNTRLYRKVLAARRIPSSLSVNALRAGTGHDDDRIRLTAYQTLDSKVTALNDEIDRLSTLGAKTSGRQASESWLQVASNYWELLYLEENRKVARAQLLEKAARAAMLSVAADPANRNAHFTLGRIALRQGRTDIADKAFAASTAHGMPSSTTVPWRAEAAFIDRDFARARAWLNELGDAFKAYPPLRQVSEYWQ